MTIEAVLTLAEKRARVMAIAKNLSQENVLFCTYMAEGYSITRSHEKSHISKKYKNHGSSGFELIKNNDSVREYIELAKEIAVDEGAHRAFASAMDKREKLWNVVERCSKTGMRFQPRPLIAAIVSLNKMDGDLAPTKAIVESTNKNLDFDFADATDNEAAQAYQDMIKQGNEST